MSNAASTSCPGFGEFEGRCENAAGGPPRENPVWCGRCDVLRIEHLNEQFALLGSRFMVGVRKDGETEIGVRDADA